MAPRPSRPPSPLPSLLLAAVTSVALLTSASPPPGPALEARRALPGGAGGSIAERRWAHRRAVRQECPPDGGGGGPPPCADGETRGVRPRERAGAGGCGGGDGDGDAASLREGTVVYVSGDGGQAWAASVGAEVDRAEEGREEAGAAPAVPCLERMGGMYDGDTGAVQYELLERVQYELGNVDNHREDYVSQFIRFSQSG